jgi:hypothetical protein
MNRHKNFSLLAMLTVGLLWTTPTFANENDADLRAQLDELKEQVSELQASRSAGADEDIEAYLDGDGAKESQGGNPMDGVTINASILVVNQNTVNRDQADGGNVALVSGLMELMFNFQVTEDLGIFANLYANTDGHLDDSSSGYGPATLASFSDGVGMDSSAGVRPRGGVQVDQAGFNYRVAVGGMDLNMAVGLIDPRTRYLTTAFSDNYRTGFLHNEFVDASGISWATNANNGENILGANFVMAFGGEKQFIFQIGWFNGEGQWFDDGQFYFEFHWKSEISGRPMNLKIMFMRDGLFTDDSDSADPDDDSNYGVEWDWKITDTIGVWAIFTGNNEDVNAVEGSWSIGTVLMGIIGSRPDDEIGFAVGMLTANRTVVTGATGDTEMVIEAYYKYITADGKMQITPHLMYIGDPGVGASLTETSLFVLGVRIYIPF